MKAKNLQGTSTFEFINKNVCVRINHVAISYGEETPFRYVSSKIHFIRFGPLHYYKYSCSFSDISIVVTSKILWIRLIIYTVCTNSATKYEVKVVGAKVTNRGYLLNWSTFPSIYSFTVKLELDVTRWRS